MSTSIRAASRWHTFAGFVAISLSHFRRNGVGLAMSLAVPLLFMMIYGYAYLLGTPDRTIPVGLLPNAQATEHWRGALPAESFRVRSIAPAKLEEHLLEGDPGLVIDRDAATGKAIVYAAPYWRPVGELLVRSLDHALEGTPSKDASLRLHTVQPATSPFYMLPAIMMMALLNIGLFSAGAKLLQERAKGTLRMYRMLPISIGWYFSAELLTKLLIALAITLGYLAIAMGVFGMSLSWPRLLSAVAISLAMAAVFIAAGLAIASVLRDYSIGVHAFTLCNLLVLFLGDLFFNASRYPLTKWIALALPTTYGMDLTRHVMFDTTLRFPAGLSLLVLGLWLAAMMMVAVRMFSYKARE